MVARDCQMTKILTQDQLHINRQTIQFLMKICERGWCDICSRVLGI